MGRPRLISACFAVALGVTSAGSSGCFVFEELDSGMEWMERTDAAKKKPSDSSTGTASAQNQNAEQQRPTGAEWWKKARSLSSDEIDASIVQCQIGGSVQFMRRTDCEARGGRAG